MRPELPSKLGQEHGPLTDPFTTSGLLFVCWSLGVLKKDPTGDGPQRERVLSGGENTIWTTWTGLKMRKPPASPQ